MDKTHYKSWADFSEDESSDTEEALPPLDPNQKQIIDSINNSKDPSFQFKIENLPYRLSGPEEVHSFLQLSESEVSIRLQYKGKKFTGFALVSTDKKEVAIKVAFKYGHCFEARPVLIFYKSSESAVWIPQKSQIPNNNLSQTVDRGFEEVKLEKEKKRTDGRGKGKGCIKQDPAILTAVPVRVRRRNY
jgi:hypothetical protein